MVSNAATTLPVGLRSFRRSLDSIDWFGWFLFVVCFVVVATAATRMFSLSGRSRPTIPVPQLPIIALAVVTGLRFAWMGWQSREVDEILDAGGTVTIRIDLPIPDELHGYILAGAVIVDARKVRHRLVDDLVKMFGSIDCRIRDDGSLNVDVGRDDEARTRLKSIESYLDRGTIPYTFLERDHSEDLEAALPALIAALR
jgi:hypothetical protein